jgi:hypothetical protein
VASSFLWLLILFGNETTVFGQSVITLDGKGLLSFDGATESELAVSTDLLDGFIYKFPVELSVESGVKLTDLHGKTICKCASLQFDNDIVDSSQPVTGHVLLRPKTADFAQILEAFGTKPDELDPIIIGRVKVKSKVYAPLRLIPAAVEIKEKRFPLSSIGLKLSNGVEIVHASLMDSNSTIKAVFDREKNRFKLEQTDLPLPDSQGELVAEFTLKHKDVTMNYFAKVQYAAKPPIRVVPSLITFQVHENGYSGRMIVMGFGPSETIKPNLAIEKLMADGTWAGTDYAFQIDHFSLGKAIGRCVLPSDQTLLAPETKSRLRFRDVDTKVSLAEFDCVLVK